MDHFLGTTSIFDSDLLTFLYSGTLWNEVYYDCDYEDLVDCGDRPRPGSTRPSTVEPSTTITTSTTSPATSETTPTPIVTDTTTHGGSTTTTSADGPTGPHPALPKKVLGMYILLADDTEDGYHSDNDDWEPLLYPYQQAGSNVLFFTFINPATMEVPVAFRKLAATRGKDTDGAVPADTLIIFAVGGYAYSLDPNPWDWLTSQQKAEQMAVKVAGWREEYGIDGVDLDLEEGAGSNKEAGPNMVHFIRKLKSLQPSLLISQPTYGFPQIQAEIDVINASWKVGGTSNNLADTVGLMVWFCSVRNGLVYGHGWDCSDSKDSMEGYVA